MGERAQCAPRKRQPANLLLDDISMRGARALLDLHHRRRTTDRDPDEAQRAGFGEEVDDETNIILGATFEPALDGVVRVSVVATGVDQVAVANTDVETEPLPVPVIPFPEPIEQRGSSRIPPLTAREAASPLRLAS